MDLTPERLLKALNGELLGEDVWRLINDLRSLPLSSALEIAVQSGIHIAGDGNIIGHNNYF